MPGVSAAYVAVKERAVAGATNVCVWGCPSDHDANRRVVLSTVCWDGAASVLVEPTTTCA